MADYSRQYYRKEGTGGGSSREGGRRRRKPRVPGYILVAADVLLIAVYLLTFAYFHHVNPVNHDMEPVQLPVAQAGQTADPNAGQTGGTPEESPDPQQSDDPQQSPAAPDEGEQSKFLEAGCQPQKTDTTFVSENVNVSVETREVDGSVCHIADIYVRDVQYLKTAFGGESYNSSWADRGYVNEMGSRVNAFVAINGDQCTGHKEGVVVRNGVLYRETPFKDVCVLYYDGRMETIPEAQFDVDAIKQTGAWQVWSFGPLLLTDGQPMESFNTDVSGVNPRSAIGMVEPGHYMLVSVDGRGESSGMSMKQLSQLFYDLGCTEAYNLDGGDTSAMALDGEIYSSPSGDRTATDIIYVAME